MGRRRDWMETFRTLGEAFFGVVRAELTVVMETAKAWGKSWAIATAIVALLLFALFWFLGLLTVAVVHGLMVWRDLALWQSALLTAGVLLLLVAIGAGVVYLLARRFESPVTATRRRLDDHIGWWNERILPDEPRHLSEGESDETPKQGDEAGPGSAAETPPGG